MDNSETSPGDDDIVTFGQFELSRTRRALLRDGEPIAIGARAMSMLITLVERAGTIVSSRELLQCVWPNAVVADGTIRTQVAHLRRIFRDADPQGDYVQNIVGRGYRFIAPVLPLRKTPRRHNLPFGPVQVIGREQSVDALLDRVRAQRLVTIVGPGGGGKTTVALSVADTLLQSHTNRWSHGARFVDLTSIAQGQHLAAALAVALGVESLAQKSLQDVVAYLSQRSMLLVLDNCEHVLDTAAAFVEFALRDAPMMHVLATSREPLRAAGESVYELPPLQEHAAIHLFVERAGAHVIAEFDDEAMSRLVEACQRLGGNPLAVVIAAANVDVLGLRSWTTSPEDDLYLSLENQPTVGPRHRTLRVAFDRSYDPLSPVAQSVFRRVSELEDEFDLDQAAATLLNDDLSYATLFECLVNLVRKSLLVADTSGEKVRYRLHGLLRAYARAKLRAT